MNNLRKLSVEEMNKELLKEANLAVKMAFSHLPKFYEILAARPQIREAMLSVYVIGKSSGIDQASNRLEEELRRRNQQ